MPSDCFGIKIIRVAGRMIFDFLSHVLIRDTLCLHYIFEGGRAASILTFNTF